MVLPNSYVEKVKTGIPGLDDVLGGGFLKGSLILLAGHPGAGKTTFSAMFIYNGAVKFGEKGVYLNFCESKRDFYAYMKNFGMDFESLEKEGKIRYIDAMTVVSAKDVEDIIRFLIESIIDLDAKRVVIDSLSVITDLLTPEKARALINNTLAKILKNLGVTAILIMDLPYGEEKIGHGIEEFITDAVFALYLNISGDKIERYLEIRKIRGIKTEYVIIPYIIKENGLEIIIPPPHGIQGSFSCDITYTTGVPKLDEMLGGGINKGSLSVIMGPSGSGKTMLALSIAIANAAEGKKVLFISFSESVKQLHERIRAIGHDPEKLSKFLKIRAINPFGYPKYVMLIKFRDIINEFKPELYIVDSLERFMIALGEEDFIRYIGRRAYELKSLGLTTIMTMSVDHLKKGAYIDDLMDNIILLRMYCDKTGIQRYLYIWKTRGKKGFDKPALLSVTDDGKVELTIKD